jgi:hypothetical protein
MFWIPGSCGDILQHLLSQNHDISTGATFNLNSQGRTVRTMTSMFKSLFPSTPDKWLRRKWTIQDCDRLVNMAKSQTIVIGTHDYAQVKFLKEYLKSDINTVGIAYDQNLWPIVLKNYCLKSAQANADVNFQYQSSNSPLYKMLKNKNVFGAWLLQDELLHVKTIPKTVNYLFDHVICLDRLLTGDLQWANEFTTSQSVSTFQQWLCLQNLFGRVRMPDHPDFIACLGYNQWATIDHPDPIALDSYDKIFIKHYVKQHNLPACRVSTHYELLNFFIENPSNKFLSKTKS